VRHFLAGVPDHQVLEAAYMLAASSKNEAALTPRNPTISEPEESDMWFLADALSRPHIWLPRGPALMMSLSKEDRK